jgi:ribulose-phosphate 3-epimerase
MAAHPLDIKNIVALLDPYVEGYHIDIMDFHFVPNLTCGFDMIHAIRKITQKRLQIHCMVEYPERYFERLELKEHDIISIHPESPSELNLQDICSLISSYNLIPSLAITPDLPIDIISRISTIHHVLLMSVYPGFSGQPFMPEVFQKIEQVVALSQRVKVPYTIAIDGGVDQNNAQDLVNAGAQELVIGSALFSTNDPLTALKKLRASLDPIKDFRV